MNVWFTRCNGETGHNKPGTPRFVPGEPPIFPNRKFNYRDECLKDGFARVGWPASGDLRNPNWRSLAQRAYGATMRPHHVRYLEQFREILSGDLVLLPSYALKYEVYLGVVVPPRRSASGHASSTAYYYHHDVPTGDWYENAHRVDVDWTPTTEGVRRTFEVPEIGGLWLRGFGGVKTSVAKIMALAKDVGLIR